MDKRKVVVFDSGVGGLTTLKYLSEMLPGEDYYYFGDYDNNPYGTKTTKELQEILKKNITYLASLNPKIIVIACNTAGTQIEYLKTITDILMYEPISVTADYIKNNLKMKSDSNILLLATEFTVKTGLYNEKLPEYNVIGQSAQILVKLAEEHVNDYNIVNEITGKYKDSVECVILGCTHFGYFEKEIIESTNCRNIVESAKVLAIKVKEYLEFNNLTNNNEKGSINYIDHIE